MKEAGAVLVWSHVGVWSAARLTHGMRAEKSIQQVDAPESKTGRTRIDNVYHRGGSSEIQARARALVGDSSERTDAKCVSVCNASHGRMSRTISVVSCSKLNMPTKVPVADDVA